MIENSSENIANAVYEKVKKKLQMHMRNKVEKLFYIFL
jgi:hypothetical protein